MSSTHVTANLYCIHPHHLFSHPLCEDQFLLQKIVNVAFHVLTLGIPLAVYHIVSYCHFRTASTQEGSNLQAIGVSSVQQNKGVKPYSSLGQEALKFAREKLKEHPEITPRQFQAGWKSSSATHQPINLST